MRRLQLAKRCLMSMMQREKRNGARTVPCGTPVLQTTLSDTQSCVLTYCDLLVRNSSVYNVRWWSTPVCTSSFVWCWKQIKEKTNKQTKQQHFHSVLRESSIQEVDDGVNHSQYWVDRWNGVINEVTRGRWWARIIMSSDDTSCQVSTLAKLTT